MSQAIRMKANPPILGRTMLYERLRDGTIHLLDWNLVSTTLGLMIEPRTMIRATGNMQNSDPYENGYTDMLEVPQATLFATYNFGGSQWPRVYNSQ